MDLNKKKRKSPSLTESTSSEKTDHSRILTGVLALGLRLADDIGANEDRNTTGKWIAHHLAKKLEAAKENPSLEAECFELILKLWASRRNFPNGDPLARYDRLLPSIESLLRAEQRYFPSSQGIPEQQDSTQKWLDAAVKLDNLSSFLIAQFLKTAVREMGGDDEELLQLAEAIESDPQTEFITIIRTLALEDEPEANEIKDPFVEHIEDLRALLAEIETLRQIE